MFKVLLWDLDGTIIDSHKAVANSLLYCFKCLGIENKYNQEMVDDFYKINSNFWGNLGIKYKTIDEILKLRFIEFFGKHNINVDPIEASKYYEEESSKTLFPFDNVIEILNDLKHKYKMYATTNGKAYVQRNKLKTAGIINIFDAIFISENVGYNKPDVKYFEKIFEFIGDYKKDEILMIGDTLNSDIAGANNAGIKCCYYNIKNEPIDSKYKIDYIITNHNELYKFL